MRTMNRLLVNSIRKAAALPVARAAALKVALLAGLLAFGGPTPAAAQQEAMRIAAVVNEDVISLFDVQSRIQLFLITSGIEDTIEIRQRLLPQVMNALIEEKLKLQEARREEI